jgi:uncharacterized protein
VIASRLAPREFNSIASVADLIESWHGAGVASVKTFRVSNEGNINFAGISAGTYSHIFVPTDVEFEASLEPVVRPLVLILVEGANLVTYTSCGGHLYQDGTPCGECHVGVLPRSRSELCSAWRAFRSVAIRVSGELVVSRATIYPWYLADEQTGRRVPVIDLYLSRDQDVEAADYIQGAGADVWRIADALGVEFGR